MSATTDPSDDEESESEASPSEEDDSDVLETALRALRARLSPALPNDEDDPPDD